LLTRSHSSFINVFPLISSQQVVEDYLFISPEPPLLKYPGKMTGSLDKALEAGVEPKVARSVDLEHLEVGKDVSLFFA